MFEGKRVRCRALNSVVERKSEYFANLSADARGRYECKVISSDLSTDPYAIDDCYWTEAPCAVE